MALDLRFVFRVACFSFQQEKTFAPNHIPPSFAGGRGGETGLWAQTLCGPMLPGSVGSCYTEHGASDLRCCVRLPGRLSDKRRPWNGPWALRERTATPFLTSLGGNRAQVNGRPWPPRGRSAAARTAA